jgi:calcineurin-like phosphoesterase family protein
VIWYTSDTHFWHQAIIDYCKRPFRTLDGQFDVRGMNEELIRRWNERVGLDDVVFHIGDFSFGSREQQREIVSRLHGHKVIILGNHDPSGARMLDVGFVEAKREMRVADGPYFLYLRHHPKEDFERMEFDFHLCGHVHEKWRRQGRIINVGVDQWDYRPVSIEELVGAAEG